MDSSAPVRHEMPRIGSLVRSRAKVPPSRTVGEVARLFEEERDVDAFAIVERHRPIGLVSPFHLLLKFADQTGYARYSDARITEVAEMAPLLIASDTALDEVIRQASQRGRAHAYDTVIVIDDRGVFQGLITVRELIEHQVTALDRTRQRESLAREQAYELQRVDDLRTRFLSMVTHELRVPVNAMIGATELVAQAYEREDQEKMAKMLPLLMSNATGLRQLINNVLDLSKLRAGKMTLLAEPVAVASILDEVQSSARSLAARSAIELRMDPPKTDLEIESDPIKLKQVLMNLVSNAIKFTDVGRVEIGARSAGRGCRFWIEDDGIGIAAEELDRLFDPFYQVEDPTFKQREGTGLGLAIVRDLVALLGAKISVASRIGEGSRFDLHLPATPPTQSTPRGAVS